MIAGLAFASPWLLAGLAALPAIWLLLRLTPPAPARVEFPPTRLLEGLLSPTTRPHTTPWWLTLLRMLIAAAVIFALAAPSWQRGPAVAAPERPLLIVAENGWAAAADWEARRGALAALIARAEAGSQSVILAPTAPERGQFMLSPLTPAAARERAAGLLPQPFGPDRAGLAAALATVLPGRATHEVHWLGDGISDAGAVALAAELTRISQPLPALTAPARPALALAALPGYAQGLGARVLSAGGAPATGSVAALDTQGRTLATAPFALAAGATTTDLRLDLPTPLRNQVARLEIAGARSAGGVALIDARSYWRRVALISGESRESATPLLSPLYYIERALRPHAELRSVPGASLDDAVSQLLAAAPSVIALADIGRLPGAAAARLAAFVSAGGTLLRFAGPRLEDGGDDLLPAPLRVGERQLGGALSWQSPQPLAAFEAVSPFAGLPVPADVNVSRQLLADPAQLGNAEVWARLGDGTPLVTAARRGAGRIVLFHVTANSDWSNLPISGLFVEMLRRIVDGAPAGGVALADLPAADAAPAPGAAAPVTAEAPAVSITPAALSAWRTLDGFGRLGDPPVTAGNLPAAGPTAPVAGPGLLPGLYGPAAAPRALNLASAETRLVPLVAEPLGLTAAGPAAEAPELLAPWLFAAAFALLALDALLMLTVLSGTARLRRAPAAAALLFAYAVLAQPLPAHADEAADAAAIDAARTTHLAYVLTGDGPADENSRAGLSGLSQILSARTAVEPGTPVGVDPERDELVFYPLLYWPVSSGARMSDAALARLDTYMKQGGMLLLDTRDDRDSGEGGAVTSPALKALLGRLDIPRLAPVETGHVVSKSFYILPSFPGRYDGATLWAEAPTGGSEDAGPAERRALIADGVSSVLVTGNDFASAWALDETGRPLNAVVPGGEEQREMAFRVGVNIVMYALTGNYKADQVHVPALLERLGQ